MSRLGEMTPLKAKLRTFLLTHPLLPPASAPRVGWGREVLHVLRSAQQLEGTQELCLARGRHWDCMIRTHHDPMFILPFSLLKSHWAGGCTGVIYHLPGARAVLGSQQRILLLEHKPKKHERWVACSRGWEGWGEAGGWIRMCIRSLWQNILRFPISAPQCCVQPWRAKSR